LRQLPSGGLFVFPADADCKLRGLCVPRKWYFMHLSQP